MDERKEDEKVNSWQLIEHALSRLDVRLDEINTRLNQLEQGQNHRTILDERRVIDRSGFGGRETSTTPSGTIERRIMIGICDVCNERLFDDEAFKICSSCGKRLCLSPKCSVNYENKTICAHCLRTTFLPLPKSQYKELVSVSNKIQSPKTISKITHMQKEIVEKDLVKLESLRLVEKKGIFIFSGYHVTEKGLQAISLYRQIYGSDFDIHVFDQELKKHILTGRKSLLRFLRVGSNKACYP